MANKNCTSIDLIRKLLMVLDNRENDYRNAFNAATDLDTKASFLGRISETSIFRTDLEMLLERLEEE